MTDPSPDQPTPERTHSQVLWGRAQRKRDRIRAEIARNRAGGHRVPTWALAAVLAVILAGWLWLLVTS
jgi:hypothetical protein